MKVITSRRPFERVPRARFFSFIEKIADRDGLF
jgi:hypothetical protein